MTPEYTSFQSAAFFGLTLLFLISVIGDFRHARFFRAIGKMPDSRIHLDKATKSFFCFLLAFYTVAQDKSNLLYSVIGGGEEASAVVIPSVEDRRDRVTLNNELEAEGLSPVGQSMLLGGLPPGDSDNLTASQYRAGAACISVTNINPDWVSSVSGNPALTNTPFGFSELGTWLPCTGALSRLPFPFVFGTNTAQAIYASSSGTLAFNFRKSSPYPHTNGIPDGTATDYLAPFQTVMGTAPTNGAFLLDADTNSATFTWLNVFLGRDSNCTASVQAELYASGDFTYRYHFPEATNNYSLFTNLFLIGAQNNGGGETVILTNALSALDPSLLPAFEIRWKAFGDLLTDARAENDFDDDGLSDLDELRLNADPRIKDTDADGISDGLEVALGTNAAGENTDSKWGA